MLLPILALAWFAGLVAADWNAAAGWSVGAGVAFVAAIAWALRGRSVSVAAVGAGCVLVALAGAARGASTDEPSAGVLADYFGNDVELIGTVTSEDDPGLTTTRYRLHADRLVLGNDAFRADTGVLVTVNQYTRLLPGDRVRVRGKVEAPPETEGFDYRAYLARRGITATMFAVQVSSAGPAETWRVDRVSARARFALEASLRRALPEPEASLAAGIAFGRDQGLSPEVQQEFRDAGLAHLTAVSGSNVVLVVALVFFAARYVVRRPYALIPAALTAAAYVGLAGASPSVLRAGLMAGVFLVGEAIGRPQAGLAALALAAAAMSAVDPGLIHDVGFRLSAAATAGLIVFGPWLHAGARHGLDRLGAGGVVPGIVLQSMVISLAASLSTLPVVLGTFGRVSVVGLVANALVAEPVFAVAFVMSFVTALLGAAWEPAGWAAGVVAFYPLRLIVSIADLSASVPAGVVAFEQPRWWYEPAGFALLAVPGWAAYRRYAPAIGPRRPAARAALTRRLVLAPAGALAVIGVVELGLRPLSAAGQLEVAFLDVGQGDATLITTPHGRRVLVDGGPSAIGLARELGAVLPHWERGIDLVILTHPQEDHVGGLPGLYDRYHVGQTATTRAENPTTAVRMFRADAGGAVELVEGRSWSLDGVRFEVTWPAAGYSSSQVNNLSVVLRVSYGERSILLTGDIEKAPQARLVATTNVTADVLKVPHHGAATGDTAFFAAVRPVAAIISAGAGNRFGHPASETLDALADTRVYRTDVNGRITVRTDGKRLTVTTER